jgi:hypothetical protein
MINNNFCLSIKSKNNTHLQCINKPKDNEQFCGTHLNQKNIVLYKEILNEISVNNISISDMSINSVNEVQDQEIDKIIFTKDLLYEHISNKKNISVYSIRKSIKNCYLNNFINTKNSKPELLKNINYFIERERYFLSNEKSVILIQSIYRMWHIYRRKMCNNDTDILSFNDKYEIDNKFFYIFHDNITKKRYAYDIRALLQIIRSEYPSCPYTCRKFTDNEKNGKAKKCLF